MTSEICGMNRLAVVLAADSATTVTRWKDGRAEERYFKGANKIFQLSDHHPIGIMIFDGADLLRVPWEVVVKEFRKTLGKKSFNSVDGYATEFFNFVSSSYWLFPQDIRHKAILDAGRTAGLTITLTNDANRNMSGDERLVEARIEVDAKHNPFGLDAGWSDGIVAAVRADLLAEFAGLPKVGAIVLPTDLDELVTVSVLQVIREPARFLDTTGIVFAGFGDHDIFPAMVEYKSEGVIFDKCVANLEQEIKIDHEMPAWLEAFAQADMSHTFTLGISQDAYVSMLDAAHDKVSQLVNDIAATLSTTVDKIPDAEGTINRTVSSIGTAVLQRAREQHHIPLRQVLSALPVDEMAELAETLINLQALKEKVTKPSETVGGPVDVAVITRSEGLVWIKRKQFFDSAMNSRYMQRQSAKFQ